MTYYFLTEELGKKLRAAIDKNEDLSSIFNSQKYKDERASWWLFQYDLGDMVFYAITQDKTESAKSILEHIQSQESQKFHYSKWAKELFEACKRDKQNAVKVVASSKKHDILEYLLEDLPDSRIRTELSKKRHGQYVHSDDVIVDTLSQEHVHKCVKHIYRNKDFGQMILVFSLGYIVLAGYGIVCYYLNSGKLGPSDMQEEATFLLTFLLTLLALIVTFILCAGIISLIVNHSTEQKCNDTVKKLQEQSQSERDLQLQDAASTTEGQEIQEGKPENIQLPPDSSVSEIAGPQAGASLTTLRGGHKATPILFNQDI